MSQVLFVIDGHAQIYRAYYALEGMKSGAGQATGAAFGFARMLDDLIANHRPDAMVATFDHPGGNFRHRLYPEYKANRKPPPPELVAQLPLAREIVEARNIPHYELEGFEADDLMGSLARQATEAGWETVLVTGDKDCGQLLGGGVRIFDPAKNVFMDSRDFTARKGVPPEKLIDLMGLWGDASDNIPGVPGVGEKTGVQLIREYGSLEALLERADEIKGKRGEFIRANRESALLSKKLAAIDRHAPVKLDLEAARLTEPNLPRLREIYDRLGFRSLLAKLEPSPAAAGEEPDADPPPPDYRLVDDPEEFEIFLAELSRQKSIAIDTETTGLDPLSADLVGISFSWREGSGFYLPFRVPSGARALSRGHLERLKPVLEDPGVEKTGHNIRFDALALRRAGVVLAGVSFDSLIASSLVEGRLSEHGLKALAKRRFGIDMTPIEEFIGEGSKRTGIDLAPVRAVARYAAADADISLRLRGWLEKRLDERGARRLFAEVELPLSAVLAEMQAVGVRVDPERLGAESAETGELLECLTREIHELAGHPFNIASPKQLAAVLFGEMGLPAIRRTQTGPSTDEAVLEELAQVHDCELADRVLEFRMYAKLKNTYLDALPKLINPETGRIHTSFSQVRTVTGRLASSNPNLQNIPVRTERGRAVRAAFIPEDGWKMLAADYSQVELRVLAALSGDPFLARAFADGQDVHRAVAAEVNGIRPEEVTREQRSSAKAVNFGVIYGQGAHGLAAAAGMSRTRAQEFIDGYFARFPRIREWMGETVAGAEKNGYVETVLGFRREIPDIRSSNRVRRARAEREAVNTVVQGSAADLIKTAMVRLAEDLRRSGLAARLLLQIHDELLLECPPGEVEPLRAKVVAAMENAIPLPVPIKVDVGVGDNWLETK